MRLNKILACSAALLMGLGAAAAVAQTNVPSSRFQPLPSESPTATSPLVEPGAYQYDAQLFAPYDYRELAEPEAPVGFYFTFDKVYTSLSRPGVQPNDEAGFDLTSSFPVGNSWVWGNRFEGGVMTQAENGWGFEYSRASGSFFAWGQDELVANPMMVEMSLHNLKLNRVFRQELSGGGWVEPYFGIRYLGMTDDTIEDTLVVLGGTTSNNRFKQTASNSAIGGHVGARGVRRFGRFGTAWDASLAAAYNSQSYRTGDTTFSGGTVFISEFNDTDHSFVPALDLRWDLSYALTRDLAFRTGAQLLYLWDGVNRANTLTTTLNPNSAFGIVGANGVYSESMVSAGFNFGVEWKR